LFAPNHLNIVCQLTLMTFYHQRFWLLPLVFMLTSSSLIQAQEVWTLERCIQTAQAKSPDLLVAQLTTQAQALNYQQALNNRLPDITGSSSLGSQFGYTIDPTTSNFVNQAIGFNSFQINGGVPVYSGGAIKNGINQAQWQQKASEADYQAASNNLGLAVAQAYLQVLLFEEQAANAQKRLDLSKQNQTRTEKLISAGSLPPNARLDVAAQIARDQQTLVQATGSLETSMVQLKNLLMVELDTPIKLEKPANISTAGTNPDQFGLKIIYQTALTNQPQITAADYHIRSAQYGIETARAALRPTVSAFASLNTNYSTLGKKLGSTTIEYQDIPVFIDGTPKILGYPDVRPNLINNPYFGQIGQNFGQNVGISVQVPIFRQNSGKLGVERARLAVKQQEAFATQAKQQLKTDIQTAIVSARVAKQSLEAAQKSVDALKISYENTEKRFAAGNTNTFELITARNSLDLAEITTTQAKYEYLFRVKIVEFYQGKTLKLGN
jgi:outer membrane protein